MRVFLFSEWRTELSFRQILSTVDAGVCRLTVDYLVKASFGCLVYKGLKVKHTQHPNILTDHDIIQYI